MADFFQISGTFPLKADVPSVDIVQLMSEARNTWHLSHFEANVLPGPPRLVKFCFECGTVTSAFSVEVIETIHGWARRFADWPTDVLRYTTTGDNERRHIFYGPDNRCIEAKLNALEKHMADLEEEWADYNHTQLAKATGECSALVDYAEIT